MTWRWDWSRCRLSKSSLVKCQEIMFVKRGWDEIYKIPSVLLRISIDAALYQLVFDEFSHLRTRFVLWKLRGFQERTDFPYISVEHQECHGFSHVFSPWTWYFPIFPSRMLDSTDFLPGQGLGKLGEWLVPNISWEHRWGYIYMYIYICVYIYIHIKSHKCRWKNIIYLNCRCLLCTFVHVCYCWEMMIQLGGDFQLMLARFLLPLPSSLWDPDIDCFMSWVLPSQMLPSAQLLNWNASSYRHVWFVICLNGFQTTCFFLESMVLAPIFFRFPAIFPRNPLTPHGTSVSSLGEKKSWWDPGRFEADHEAEVEGDFGLVLFDSSIDSSTSSIPTPWHICLAGRFQGRGPGGVSLSEFHVRWPQDLAGKVTGFFDVLCEEGPSNRGVLSATT